MTVLPLKPTQPQSVSLAVEEWDEVKVSFMAPDDTGGEEVEGYMVEWWPATVSNGYGSAEVQTFKIGGDVDGEISPVVLLLPYLLTVQQHTRRRKWLRKPKPTSPNNRVNRKRQGGRQRVGNSSRDLIVLSLSG